jgi:hypothetical protein
MLFYSNLPAGNPMLHRDYSKEKARSVSSLYANILEQSSKFFEGSISFQKIRVSVTVTFLCRRE